MSKIKWAEGVTDIEKIAEFVESCEEIINMGGSCASFMCGSCPFSWDYNEEPCWENGVSRPMGKVGDKSRSRVKAAKEYIKQVEWYDHPEYGELKPDPNEKGPF